MKTAVLRSVASFSVAAGLVLVAAGAVVAADPIPTLGGVLSRNESTLTVKSNGNQPVHVAMSADVVTLSATTFDLQPGESHSLTFSGDATGKVRASMTLAGPVSGDVNGVTLALTLHPYTPPMDWSPFAIGGLIAAGLVLVVARVKPWRLRIVRAT